MEFDSKNSTLQAKDGTPVSYHAVIVDYGKAEAVHQLIRALAQQSLRPESISVVDNSPAAAEWSTTYTADSVDVPVSYEHFPENIGYTRACNIGATGTSTHLLFLNPDIELLSKGTMRSLLRHVLEHRINSPIGVAQKNPDGSYEPVARRSPTIRAILARRVPFANRLFSKFHAEYMDAYDCAHSPEATKSLEVDWLQSSFLLVPRALWNKIGGFDERYFVFMADVEYGNRCREHGHPMQLLKKYCVAADGVRSSHGGITSIFRSKSLRIHLKDAATYFIGSSFTRRG